MGKDDTIIIKSGGDKGNPVVNAIKEAKWGLLALFLGILAVLYWLREPEKPDPYEYGKEAGWMGGQILGYVLLFLISIVVVSGTSYMLYRLALDGLKAWKEYKKTCQETELELQRRETQNGHEAIRGQIEAVRIMAHAGRLGALVKPVPGGWQIHNLDAERRSVLLRHDGQVEPLNDDPLAIAQIAALHQLELQRAESDKFPNLQHYHQESNDTRNGVDPAARDASDLPWPTKVPLRDLVSAPPSLHRLALGVTMDPESRIPRPLHADLAQMVHVAVGGSSGWGKSVFLRSLAYQLTTSTEDCRLALIDLEAVTFSPFANADRLLWPVADTDGQALAIAEELMAEMNRRKMLYAEYENLGIDSLDAYNQHVSEGERLVPWICLVDEAPALMSGDIEGAFRQLARRARKFGVWLVLGSQGWRSEDIDASIRDMLSVCIHFKAKTPSQSRVLLGDSRAAEINVTGRALALLPGQPLTEMQAPWVTPRDITDALAGQDGPIYPAPPEIAILPAGVTPEQADQIYHLNLLERSRREIEEAVFGHSGGAAYRKVRDVLASGWTPGTENFEE